MNSALTNEASIPCSHCGLPVPAHLRRGSDASFCCWGCQTIYHTIQAGGLGSFYQRVDAPLTPQAPSGNRFEEFADEHFLEHHVRTRQWDGEIVSQAELLVSGIDCAACVWLLEKLPSLRPGVVQARLNYTDQTLHVSWLPTQVSLPEIAQTLDSLGHTPRALPIGRTSEEANHEDRNLLVRIGVAAAAAGNVMLLSLALYSGDADGMERPMVELFRWASFGITVPSVLFTGARFFKGALKAILTRTPHMDLPLSIGILAALVWGTYSTFSGQREIYFDSVTMLVLLLLVGRYLEAKKQRAARRATETLLALSPSFALVVTEDGTHKVSAAHVPKGATVLVRSGDCIAIDGTVLSGESHVDESLLSGESQPQNVSPGTIVAAGTINLTGPLTVQVSAAGRETRLGKLVQQVEAAGQRKAPIVQLADRVSGIFVALVLLGASATFVLWLSAGVAIALDRAIALLIVTCPCALGLATPFAASVALGRAAQQGILIRGMRSLELLSRPGLVVFDKTGTLTQGQLHLADWDGAPEIASLVRAAESNSAHPIARAFLRDLPVGATPGARRQTETPGRGIAAQVGTQRIAIGTASFVRQKQGIETGVPRARDLVQRGLSPVFIAVDGELRAIAGFGDTLRPDAKPLLERLQRLGYQIAILSGDRQEIVDQVAVELDVKLVTARGEQSPEDKLEYIEAAAARGNVLMVGDGVNDAAALSIASVGIAVHGGAEASLEAADVAITEPGLAPIFVLMRGARDTMTVIRRNLRISLGYNLVAAALAITGVITPLLAAVLMPLSSLAVVTLSFRNRVFRSSTVDRNDSGPPAAALRIRPFPTKQSQRRTDTSLTAPVHASANLTPSSTRAPESRWA